MKHLKIKRRGVLLGVAATFALGALPGFNKGMSWLRRGHAPKTLAETMFSDLATARMIGVRYLAQATHECDAAVLAAELPAGCAVAPTSRQAFDDIRETIDAQRQRDFAAGDTVIIDGWILARTEARLCALTVLTA